MAIKIRKQIYIEADQNTILKRLSEERGMPEAEIIREAITQHVQGPRARRRDLRVGSRARFYRAVERARLCSRTTNVATRGVV